MGTYGCGLSLLVREDAVWLLTNDCGREDGRFGSWIIGGGRGSMPHSALGLCRLGMLGMFCMFCKFGAARGCGEMIAPIDWGCVADCGPPCPAGKEKGECWIGGGCGRDWGWPFRSRLSEGEGLPSGGLSKNCGFDCVDLPRD